MNFKALLSTKTGETISTRVTDLGERDLMPGDVTVSVGYSTVNYKDAMAISGRAPVIRQFPLIPGIDFAGTVEASTYPRIAVGDRVVANGWGWPRQLRHPDGRRDRGVTRACLPSRCARRTG